MSFKYGILCIGLFIIVLFLAIKSYDALTHPLNLTPDKAAAKKSEARTENSPATGVVTKPTSVASHFIAEKNIFSPERKDFQTVGSDSSSRSVIRPEVILYGITIAGNYKSASLVSPGRPLKKGERDLMTLKLGERIGEYKLAKVLSDRITLEAQGDSFEVLLYDAKAPKKRGGGPSGVPSQAFTPTSTPRPFVRTEATRGTKGSVQEKTSPSQTPMPVTPAFNPSQIASPIPTPTQVPGSAPTLNQIPGLTPSPGQIPGFSATPAQLPASMSPTIMSAPMVPTPVTLPPEMGQPVPVPPGMGQPIPLPSGVPVQPSSPEGK
jgi:hypothetical protein